MTKERVICPECGHRHTIQYGVQAKTIGVRSRPAARKGEFNYEITMPEHMSEDEPVRFSSIRDDLIGAAILGVLAGGTCGLIVSPLSPGYEGQAVIIGASIATTCAWGWLQAETGQRLKATLPWFIRQKSAWQAGAAEVASNEVNLTIDHRTEAGRTIQYFGTLPVDAERFNQWAEAVLGTRVPAQTLAIANWTGSGNLFSRLEYDKLLAQLQAAGTVLNRPGKGNVLTGGGRRAIKQHLKATTPPTGAEAHAYA